VATCLWAHPTEEKARSRRPNVRRLNWFCARFVIFLKGRQLITVHWPLNEMVRTRHLLSIKCTRLWSCVSSLNHTYDFVDENFFSNCPGASFWGSGTFLLTQKGSCHIITQQSTKQKRVSIKGLSGTQAPGSLIRHEKTLNQKINQT